MIEDVVKRGKLDSLKELVTKLLTGDLALNSGQVLILSLLLMAFLIDLNLVMRFWELQAIRSPARLISL